MHQHAVLTHSNVLAEHLHQASQPLHIPVPCFAGLPSNGEAGPVAIQVGGPHPDTIVEGDLQKRSNVFSAPQYNACPNTFRIT